jgi:hypothetical protein
MTTIERMGLLVARYGLSQYHCNDDDADDQTDAAIAAESHAAHTALLTAIHELVEERDRLQADSNELTMMVRRLVRQVRKHEGHNTVVTLAMLLLTTLSGTGRPLRDAANAAIDAARKGET